jgi:hypothetical protein
MELDAADALGTLWHLSRRAHGPHTDVFWANAIGSGVPAGYLFVLSMGGGGYANLLAKAVLALRDHGVVLYLAAPGPVGVFRLTDQAQSALELTRGLGC